MKIALIDDDEKSLECLEAFIVDQFGAFTETEHFSSGEEFIEKFCRGAYDLIITDIFMGELTGIDVARLIREKDKDVKLVFCTSSNEFAGESYEVNACYYLHKPFSVNRFKEMLDRLNLEKMELSRVIKLPDEQSVVLRNIVFADFASHCVTFHSKSGDDVVSRVSFAEVEPMLCAHSYFCSPSKGVVVNFYEVAAQSDNVFVMSDGTRIPISRRKAKDVSEAYAGFRFELLRNGGAR